MARHIVISRFGLMHMIAANLCEWLYVLVEETKHEIIHLGGTSLFTLSKRIMKSQTFQNTTTQRKQ